MTCRIYTVDKTIPDFVSSSLSGHRDYIINAWFSEDMKNVGLIIFPITI
jgi:periodic tryptophan protein 2